MQRILPDQKAKVAALSVLSNTTLVALKLIAGFVTGSVSIISEAIHSGLDLIAALIAYISVQISRRPPDKEHQYGHGKFENISGTIEALLIFVAAIWIIKEAYDKIVNGAEVETVTVGVLVMGVSAVANFAISTFLMKTARKTNSVALEADAMHLRTDVYTSIGVLAGLAILKITGIQLVDPIIAMGVAALIIKAAYDLTLKAFRPLLDTALSPAEEAEIIQVLDTIAPPSVLGYHKLRTRRSGPDVYVDLHLVVARDLSIEEAHALSHQLEDEIKARVKGSNVLIHAEPCSDRYCEGCSGCAQKAAEKAD